jgi:hypothetical protein
MAKKEIKPFDSWQAHLSFEQLVPIALRTPPKPVKSPKPPPGGGRKKSKKQKKKKRRAAG